MSGDTPPLHVSGGSGGITANRDAILGLSSSYRDTAGLVEYADLALRAAMGHVGAGLLRHDALPAAVPALQIAALEAGADASSALHRARSDAGRLGGRLLAAAMHYPWGSDLIDDVVGSSVSAQLERAIGDSWALVREGPQRFLVTHPGAVDALADDGAPILELTPLAPLVGAMRAYRAVAVTFDGHGTAVAVGTPVTGPAPRSLADVADDLATRDEGPGGSIDVRVVTNAAGERHVIVDITGIDTLLPFPTGSDPADLVACARAIDGRPTAYEQGVFDAMRRAGVRPDDPVLVVGHSLGGMIAVNVARSAARTGAFRVTHVITEGSPVGRTVGRVPESVQVLSIENSHDVVPHLDGRENPDRPNVVTVTGAAGDGRTVSGDHDSRTVYVPLARAVDASRDPSVRAFLGPQAGGAGAFLGGGTAVTHTYRVERS